MMIPSFHYNKQHSLIHAFILLISINPSTCVENKKLAAIKNALIDANKRASLLAISQQRGDIGYFLNIKSTFQWFQQDANEIQSEYRTLNSTWEKRKEQIDSFRGAVLQEMKTGPRLRLRD